MIEKIFLVLLHEAIKIQHHYQNKTYLSLSVRPAFDYVMVIGDEGPTYPTTYANAAAMHPI